MRRRWFPKVRVTALEPVRLGVDPPLKGRAHRQAAGAALYQIMSDLVFRTSDTNRTIVEAVIDEQGSVSDVCAYKGDPRLVQVTMDALRQWKFTPGLIDGRPSAFRFTSTTNYKLR